MKRGLRLASVAGAVALSCGVSVPGEPAASDPAGLTLELHLPPGPVLVAGAVSPICVITNVGPRRVEVCILEGGEQWTYHTRVDIVSKLVTSDRNICKSEFALDPGEKYSWQPRVSVGDIVTGTLKLELEILFGPRDSHGRYPPKFFHLASQPIPIQITGAQ